MRIELTFQLRQSCVLPLNYTCILWQEGRDSNPNRAVLETAVLPIKLPTCVGVRNRTRTYNFLLVGQTLSQLSYTNRSCRNRALKPISLLMRFYLELCDLLHFVILRFVLKLFSLMQDFYLWVDFSPVKELMVELMGIEPTTFSLQSYCSPVELQPHKQGTGEISCKVKTLKICCMCL